MSEWTKSPIQELLSGQWPGEWGFDPTAKDPGVRVYRSTELDDDGHVHEGVVRRSIPAGKLAAKKLQVGDTLLEASGGTPGRPVGRVGYYDPAHPEVAMCANFLRVLRPKAGVSGSYLRWALLLFHRSPEIWRYQQQTTGMSNLNVRGYLGHRIDVAPKEEQPRIAEILSTVDEAIEQTKAMIAKTQQIKAGLMRDLFTRGVTPDGQLRPPRDEAPHLYQKSPLGWIPKGWNVELLDKVATRKSGHTPSQSVPAYWNGGIKWLSLADSWRLDQVHVTETEKNISQAGLENSSAVMLPTGTVVLSRDGSRLGKSSILGSGMAVSQHFMAWICGEGLDKDYLYWWLQYRRCEFENVATGSTIPTIGLQFFKRYTIRLPCEIGEQIMIGKLLLSVHHQVLALEQSRESMVQIKSGLMHDLLTGHVRVPASAERTKAGR
jgi:type I restriction enzyme S subunit